MAHDQMQSGLWISNGFVFLNDWEKRMLFCDMWHLYEIHILVSVNKVLLNTAMAIPLQMWSLAAFTEPWQSWAVVTETTWPTSLKYLPSGLLQEKFAACSSGALVLHLSCAHRFPGKLLTMQGLFRQVWAIAPHWTTRVEKRGSPRGVGAALRDPKTPEVQEAQTVFMIALDNTDFFPLLTFPQEHCRWL